MSEGHIIRDSVAMYRYPASKPTSVFDYCPRTGGFVEKGRDARPAPPSSPSPIQQQAQHFHELKQRLIKDAATKIHPLAKERINRHIEEIGIRERLLTVTDAPTVISLHRQWLRNLDESISNIGRQLKEANDAPMPKKRLHRLNHLMKEITDRRHHVAIQLHNYEAKDKQMYVLTDEDKVRIQEARKRANDNEAASQEPRPLTPEEFEAASQKGREQAKPNDIYSKRLRGSRLGKGVPEDASMGKGAFKRNLNSPK